MQVQRPQPFPKYFASCIWLLAFCLSHLATFAQVFPIQVNTSITPPYSPYLADYTTPGSQRLVTQIRANDITLSDYAVKLRLTIEGVGITIRTKQTFTPQPITVEGGLPLILYGEDLIEYFRSDNLDFAGYSKKEFDKTGKLPEGVYRFIIEVLDYNRGTVVSNKGSAVAWIILNDPPLLNLPRKDAKIKILDPTNIPFTWTPRHTGSPNSAFSTEYIFRLVEIWPANRNPYDAFLSQPTLYEVTTTQSQIIYGMAEPALIPGRKYAWQVQARDIDGKDLFKNQGKSEVYVFQFGDELAMPENLRKETSNASAISLRWEPPAIGEMPDQYRIRYKTEDSDKWSETVTQQTWISLLQLTASTNYDVQVRGEKETRSGEYTTSLRVSTLASNPDNGFNCGAPVNLTPPGNNPPLLSLSAGDIVSCGDFKAVVTEATRASNGTFAGKGLMQVKMFNGANVEVAFSGSINSVYQFTSGGFVSTYEQGSTISQMVDNAYKIGEEKEETDTKPADSIGKEATYVVPVEIVSVVVSEDGKIVVTDDAGNETEYEIKKDEKTGEIKETIIQDKSGDQWVVKKDGVSGETTVTKLTEGSAATASTTVQEDPVKDRIIVLILEQFKEEIAAWLRDHGKGPVDDEILESVMALQKNFPEDEEVLEYIHDTGIPYFEQHPLELTSKVEDSPSNKQLLDIVSKSFISAAEVEWNKIAEEDQDALRNATAEELVLDWWERLPHWKRAAKILAEHLEATNVYENIIRTCDNVQCIITADLKLGEDITYTMEVTINSSMSADALTSMLMFEYRVDLWDAFNVGAEDIWDELYHWWRKQDDDLIQHKGLQVSMLNFMADVYTAPTLVPAVQGWITGKHWRDGHDLAGWEQALAALDFLVAEEIVKGCITNFVVKVGTKTVNLLRLTEGTKYLVQKSIEKGLKFSVIANDEVTILTKGGQVVGRIVGDVLTIPYAGFGGNIICNPNKTTTILGKWLDPSGAGTSVIIDSKLFKVGENRGGINVLSFDGAGMTKTEQWAVNFKWLNEAAERGDEIRVVSDPTKASNIWVNGIIGGEKSFFGLETDLLRSLGYSFDEATFTFKK